MPRRRAHHQAIRQPQARTSRSAPTEQRLHHQRGDLVLEGFADGRIAEVENNPCIDGSVKNVLDRPVH